MPLAEDLLKQAIHLASKEKKRPQQASLRRSISTAYYALFHLLSAAASRKLIPNRPRKLAVFARRALAHGDMKQAAKALGQSPPGRPYIGLLTTTVPPELNAIAATFVALQDERHAADYDTARVFTRPNTVALVKRVEEAFRDWRLIQNTPDASVFLTMLFLWKQLSSRS